jgi:hypothetical protein
MQAAYGETQAANEDTRTAHVETQLAYQQHYTDFKEMEQTLTAFSSFSKIFSGHKRIEFVLFAADSSMQSRTKRGLFTQNPLN